MHHYDELQINELRLPCIIGVTEEERSRTQEIIITVSMFADLIEACKNDDLEATINYSTVETEIKKLVEHSSFFLIEHLAENIAALCLSYNKSKRVEVTIEKPQALAHSRSAGVRIVREKTAL